MVDQRTLEEEIGTQFDGDTQKQTAKKVNDLKKSNIKAVFGTGIGRISFIVVSVVFVFFMIFGLYQLSKKSHPAKDSVAGSAAGAILPNQPAQGDHMVATDEEANMRKVTIAAQAENAQKSGTPFLAPPVLKQEAEAQKLGGSDLSSVPKGEQKGGAEAERLKIQGQQHDQGQGSQSSSLQRQLDELSKLRERLSKDEISPQMLTTLGREKDGKNMSGKIVTSYYTLPDRAIAPAAPNSIAPSNANPGESAVASMAGKTPFIGAGEAFYCQFNFGINTDASSKDVVGTCLQGKLKGATVIGKYQPSPDNAADADVSVTFDKLRIPGKATQAITAIAVNEETLTSGLADEVNDHSLKKFGGLFVASMLRGMGKAASIVTGQTTTTTSGAQTVQTTSVDPLSTSRQVQISLGEVGVSAGDLFLRRAESIKPTVKVNPKKTFGLVFLADIY
jgi:intracellular multiplication protein IcmE